jgi:hypothetical protein
VTAASPKISGINLSRPSDSGINLQSAGGLGRNTGDGADSIELAPLSDEEIETTAPKAKPAKPKPSLSATPPPGAKKGEKDIFDDTDFEVDVALSDEESSDDQTVQLEAASDFDLEDSESGSEVFAVDEEAVDQNAATAMGPAALVDDDDEDDDGFDAAVSSEMTSAWSNDSTSAGSERAQPAMIMSREAEAEWSGLWVGVLGATTVMLLLSAYVSMDLVRNLYDFHSDSPPSGLVKAIAGMFGG